MEKMPKWADLVLTPLISILLAFGISALVVAALGFDPWEAVQVMVSGAVGTSSGWGYTLYFATNFIFTGLAVAVAYHAGLFNIGGEGQALIGGLGVALLLLHVPFPHWSLALLAAMVAAGLFGAAWSFIPAILQAKRGSHIVITTIMFNFIAAALLVEVIKYLRPVGSMDPASPRFPASATIPRLSEILQPLGIDWARHAPVNITFLIALAFCLLVWLLLWHTRLGYEIRAFGKSEKAARYAGISPVRITIVAMLISGALAGLMAVNTIMGLQGRLILNHAEGAGFIGIAVALMGRNHPVGILLAALLFGALYQGGQELAMMTTIPPELITVIQALVILFTGALDNMVRMPLERLFLSLRKGKS
ncbi:MAG: ABC transporter permease [Paracoccus sp. (in: a-proteobacteria)]|uniref:ABC transporter permease n=1 Tax=Paracoccus sp. TaxID=267 RepID=UPI0026DFACA2|nr:ABC transporter permease [Paracoccus sp. (in: a-proteobacteria)]MDO5620455.1 ABC transporter permease [Paracoccus sp. (in: a-proteobacteria)]